MPRPAIVLNMFASLDGRITTAPGINVNEWTAGRLDGKANLESHKLFDELECDALLSGSETCIVWGAHQVQSNEPGYWPAKSRAFIVVDGRGRLDWSQTNGLLVITREDVSPAYREQLQRKQIRAIFAGRGEHVDLGQAMEALYEMGFRRIGLSGGGGINGAFLRAGLIDEISLLFAPLVIGGRTTPTLFDCPDLSSLQGALQLQLLETGVRGEGAVWLHYKVMNASAQS